MDEKSKVVDLVNYVDSKRVTKMVVSSLPVKVYKDFKSFAINNAGDNYAMSIKMLLDFYNFSVEKEDIGILKEDVLELKKIVQDLINKVQDNTIKQHKNIPTFGKKDEDE